MKIVRTLFRFFAVMAFAVVASGFAASQPADASDPIPAGRGHCCRSTYNDCVVCCPVRAAYGTLTRDGRGWCFYTLDDCLNERLGMCYPCGGASCG